MHAEDAYLFRHALLRDAAYQMQIPRDRAALHKLAILCIEAVHGGPAPLPDMSDIEAFDIPLHPLDPVAAELVQHAELAQTMECADGFDTQSAANKALSLYLQRAACHCDRMHRSSEGATLWRRAGELSAGEIRLACLLRSATSAHRDGNPRLAEALLLEVVEGGRGGSEGRLVEIAQTKLASVLRELGSYTESEEFGLSALKSARARSDFTQEAIALGNLGTIYRETGRVEEAEDCYKQSLKLFRTASATRYEAVALASLAALYQVTRRAGSALSMYSEALRLSQDAGDLRFKGMTIGNMGIVFQGTKRFEEAERCYEQALAIHREVGNRRSEGIVLGNYAGMIRETGDPKRAAEVYESALSIHRELENRAFEGGHLGYYAICLIELGRHEEAKAAWQTARQLLAQHGDTVQINRGWARVREACINAGIEPFEEVGLEAAPPLPAE